MRAATNPEYWEDAVLDWSIDSATAEADACALASISNHLEQAHPLDALQSWRAACRLDAASESLGR